MNFPPKTYQEKAKDFALKNPYSILSLDMGLGKSYLALYLREILGQRTLIICPSFLIPVWKDEIKKMCSDSPVISVFDNGKSYYWPWDTDIVITSYELAQKMEELFDWADMLVIDESHMLKSLEAKRTQFFHRVIFENSIKRVYMLTGTPIKNRVHEFYSSIAICNYNPKIEKSAFLERFPDAVTFADHFSYREQYTLDIGYKMLQVVNWKGIREERIPELRSYLKGIYFRVNFDSVASLVPIREKNILMSTAMDRDLPDFSELFNDWGEPIITPTAKLQAAVKKVPFTVKYTKNIIDEMGCAVVYTDQVPACQAIAKELGVTAITGLLSKQARDIEKKKFMRGETSVIVATYGSFSVGVDLTRASDLIINDYPWVPGDMKQAIYRIRRINQTKPCVIHRIFGSPQDEYIFNTILEKSAEIDRVT